MLVSSESRYFLGRLGRCIQSAPGLAMVPPGKEDEDCCQRTTTNCTQSGDRENGESNNQFSSPNPHTSRHGRPAIHCTARIESLVCDKAARRQASRHYWMINHTHSDHCNTDYIYITTWQSGSQRQCQSRNKERHHVAADRQQQMHTAHSLPPTSPPTRAAVLDFDLGLVRESLGTVTLVWDCRGRH